MDCEKGKGKKEVAKRADGKDSDAGGGAPQDYLKRALVIAWDKISQTMVRAATTNAGDPNKKQIASAEAARARVPHSCWFESSFLPH